MTPAPSSALIVKPGSMGDVIHALPVASTLKSAYPRCHIAWLVDQRWSPLLDGNPWVDERIPFPRQKFGGLVGLIRSIPWAVGLRRIKPDVTLDLQGLLRSGLFTRCARSKSVLGLSDAREGARFFFDQTARTQPGEHSVLRYLRICSLMGIPMPSEPDFWLPPGKPHAAMPEEPFILIHPFARGRGKSLSLSALQALCEALAPRKIVLAGAIAPGLPDWMHTLNLLGRTDLHELVFLIRRASYMVSVDSGPAHIAAAVGTPLLAIHSWSNPVLVGPFSKHAHIWHRGRIRKQNFQSGNPATAAESTLPSVSDIPNIAKHIVGMLTLSDKKSGC